MIPTLGRIVHYVLPEGFANAGAHRAAMITNVETNGAGLPTEVSKVSLTVFLDGRNEMVSTPPGAFVFRANVEQDPTGKKPGTWHEPERVS